MKIMTEITEGSWEKAAIAIGKFEGLHLGHQKLIKKIVEKQRAGYMPVAFTFAVSPRVYFGKGKGMLFTKEERRDIFEQWRLGCLCECPFNERMASMDAGQFVEEILCEKLHVAYLVVGPDFRFGKNRQGNIELLQKYEQQGMFQLEVVEKQTDGQASISSTRIRDALENGELKEVQRMLGFAFFLEGEVVSGNQLGRTWGIPTANMMLNPLKLLPPTGVYFSNVLIDGKVYHGITNIGTKPTIGGQYEKSAETFLYDFNQEIYGKKIKIELLEFVRKEQKYDSIEELVKRLRYDISCGEQYFGIGC